MTSRTCRARNRLCEPAVAAFRPSGTGAAPDRVRRVSLLMLGSIGGSARTGAAVGLLAWLGFTLTSSLDTLREGREGVGLAINNGLFALTYVLFGAVLAVWR